MPHDNPYDEAEAKADADDFRSRDEQQKEEAAWEEFYQRRQEKRDEAYELNDPKHSTYLDRLYDCEE